MGSSSELQQHSRKSSMPKVRESFELQTIHEDEECLTELEKLKSVATRLDLPTKRPSIVEWRATLDKPPFLQNGNCSDSDDQFGLRRCLECCEKTEVERKEELQRSINWIKDELAAMKSQDHVLAMQLMRLRSEIQQLRLQRSITEHKELIEDAAYSMEEELEQKTGLCDTPVLGIFLPGLDNPLKDFGVTRMNLNARRFSLR
ncbi:protein FAM167A-like [Acanthaster planci]|uniref:Protein FAM167A-like n=1 Tax=Acanthaster planci TaxID=133434 RepID=A0A8B7ZFK6_ACAPL|nr:protein FAM167A-like [Acanthaster planci]XP_022103645.1 protein FAM167A-like [Acanthaster planci]